MRDPAIDQMDLSNPFVESVDCGKNLRNHPSLNDFVFDQVCSIFTIDCWDQRIRIFYIPHDTQDVAYVNHLCRLERSGHCARREICIHIQYRLVIGLSDWRNNGYDLSIDSLAHTCQIKRRHLTHITNIDQTFSINLRRETFGLKYVATGKTFGVPTKFLHGRHNSGSNQAIKDIFDDFDGNFVGYSQAIHKTGCLACLTHALSNRLPTTVNQNRVNPNSLQ